MQALTLYNLCESLHCLPRAGGLWDQDPLVIEWFIAVLNARAAKAQMDKAKEDAAARNPS